VDDLPIKLRSLGFPRQYDLETAGGGHGFAYYNRMVPAAIEFPVIKLEEERRRIL
jgi:hypothetical protein